MARLTHREQVTPVGPVILVPSRSSCGLVPYCGWRDGSGWVSQSCTRNSRRRWESISLPGKTSLAAGSPRSTQVTQHSAREGKRLTDRGCPGCYGRGSSLVIVLSSNPVPRPLLVSSCPALPPAASSRSPTVPPRAQLLCLPPIHAACLHHPVSCALLPASQSPLPSSSTPYALKGFS